MRIGQQLRRVWRCHPFRSKMSADTQVSGIFSLFDYLMACPRVARCFLLRANVIIQFSVACFKFGSRPSDVFFYCREFRLRRVQLLLGQTHSIRTPQARPDKFCSLFRKTRSPRGDAGGSCFQVRRSWIERMQIGELFQEIAICSFTVLNAAFHACKLAFA